MGRMENLSKEILDHPVSRSKVIPVATENPLWANPGRLGHPVSRSKVTKGRLGAMVNRLRAIPVSRDHRVGMGNPSRAIQVRTARMGNRLKARAATRATMGCR